MPQQSINFHPLALAEFHEACAWYGVRSDHAQGKFKVAVDAAIARIASSPETLPKYSNGFHWVRVEKFRYIRVFRERSANEIVVVAVAHTARRPATGVIEFSSVISSR
jgi:plasmid stabilization system protein ParE